MITKGDDYPIHQTPDPIAYSGTDRNFYDRYFFNGYTRDGSIYFTTALGVYPHLNIIDASFCVVYNGVQHNLHASGHLNMERMDTVIGPISVEVVEPLTCLRITVDDNQYGISADLKFYARTVPIKEPRFTRRIGPRAFMDVTRFTQNGTYEGWINVKGEKIEVNREEFLGTRDRSWGIRPIAERDPQPIVPPVSPQFYWLWAPLNFEDKITLYHVNEDEHGYGWNQSGVICGLGEEQPVQMERSWSNITYKSGTRHADGAVIYFENREGKQAKIELFPQWNYYMMGMGYNNPDWNHGKYKGELAVGYDSFKIQDIKTSSPPYRHIQAFVKAKLTLFDGKVQEGVGILEQFIVGPHYPSGFNNDEDVAP